MEIKKLAETITGNGNFILYGSSGSGKTYSISTLPPKTLILSAEKGLRTLVDISPDIDVADVNTVEDLREIHEFLETTDAYDVVVIDSLSEVGEMALLEAKEKTRDGRLSYGMMAETIAGLIKAYNDLPQTVIFIAQEERVAQEGLNQVDHLYAPSIPGKSFMSKIPFKFDYVFCLRTKFDDEGLTVRAFQTGPDGVYLAKARTQRLDQMEEADWASIFNKLATAPTKGE